jgi:hypothetical protein
MPLRLNTTSDISHFGRKLWRTFLVISSMWCAQMFGEYEYSSEMEVGDEEFVEYARYHWRGRNWIVPTSHTEMLK